MAKHVYRVTVKGGTILPRENGGTRTLQQGQIVIGPHFAKFLGKGLEVVVHTPPKPKAEDLPAPFQTAGEPVVGTVVKESEEPEGEEEPEDIEEEEEEVVEIIDEPESEPKGVEVARSKPPEEPPAEEEEEPEEERDSLPKSRSEMGKMRKNDLIALCTELGLDTEGTNSTLAARIAEELDL